jgi:hypothetical protein
MASEGKEIRGSSVLLAQMQSFLMGYVGPVGEQRASLPEPV